MDTFDDQLIRALRAFQDECVRVAHDMIEDVERQRDAGEAGEAGNTGNPREALLAAVLDAMDARIRETASQVLADVIGAIDVEALVRRTSGPPVSPAPPLEDNEDD